MKGRVKMDLTVTELLSNPDKVAFPKLGLEFNISKDAFNIFGLDIKWYGILIATGLLLAMIYCFKRMKEFGIDGDRAIDVVSIGVIAAIIGARAYYIIFYDDKSFKDFFDYRSGGLAVYGGLIGALLIGALVAKIRKVKILPFFDIGSIGILIGQAIGRWGNFTNKETFGSATTMPWGMVSASIQTELGSAYSDTVVMAHPCFLYESLWCIIGFIILHFYSKHRKFDGEVFLMYSAWYGLGRFFIEGLRTDSLYLGTIKVSQLVAAFCFVVSLFVIIFVRSKIKRSGEKAVLYVDTEESKKLLIEAEEKLKKDKEKKLNKAAQKEARKISSEVKSVETIDKTEDNKDDVDVIKTGEEEIKVNEEEEKDGKDN